MELKSKTVRKLIKGHWATKGLVGFWGMMPWEFGGNQVFDLSGNGNTGTFVNGVTWTTGKFGPALNFNPTGDNDYVSLATIFNDADEGTIIQWIKPREINVNALNVSYCGGLAADNKRLYIGCRNTGGVNYLILRVGDDDYLFSTTNPVVGNLYCLAGTFVKSGATKIYINGILENTGTHSVGTIGDTIERIGAYDGTNYGFDGDIELTYVCNRVLSASENARFYKDSLCMFERDPIELWSPATIGAPPVGNAGIMTTNTGYWGATF